MGQVPGKVLPWLRTALRAFRPFLVWRAVSVVLQGVGLAPAQARRDNDCLYI